MFTPTAMGLAFVEAAKRSIIERGHKDVDSAVNDSKVHWVARRIALSDNPGKIKAPRAGKVYTVRKK